jgi:hypothetical protein
MIGGRKILQELTSEDKKSFQEGLAVLAKGQEVDSLEVTEGAYIPKERLEWLKRVLPADIKLVLKPQDGTTICAADKCQKVVEPSRYEGVRKIYCSRRCGNRTAQKAYYQRTRAQLKGIPVLDVSTRKVNRVKPTNVEVAEAIYRKHTERVNLEKGLGCPQATPETAFRCPSRGDPFSQNKTCLIYAVLADDMKECWAKERGETYLREWTTNDGRWIDETEMSDSGDPHLQGIRVERNVQGIQNQD